MQPRNKALVCYGFRAYIPFAMITDEIKELVHAEPFRPIRIVLTDRQAFTVAHTDYLMISPDRQTVLLYDEHNRFKIINAQQIKLVEPVELSASGSAA